MLHNPTPTRHERGAMLITMSILFITLIGFAAVAIDVGHLMVARNELQNAADSAALAGANCLDKTTSGSGTDCTSTQSSTLNWAIASTKASNSIGLNKSDGTTLVSGTISTGYKNLSGTPAGLQPTSLSPVTTDDKPAVQVSLSRASGKNGGPVLTLITNMFGGAAVPITANAVAVISAPGNVTPNTKNLIPQVIDLCMFTLYWNSATNSPVIYTGSPVDPYGLSKVNQPWEVRIGSSYHYGTCNSGQWTSFGLDVNSQSGVKGLIQNGNPTPLAIGDNTWIEPGTKTASYNDLSSQYPTPPGADVTLIVVNMPTLPTSGGGVQTPIYAFAGFHIDDIQGGSGKYIQGHFISSITTGGSSGIGPSFGSYTPPRLAQ